MKTTIFNLKLKKFFLINGFISIFKNKKFLLKIFSLIFFLKMIFLFIFINNVNKISKYTKITTPFYSKFSSFKHDFEWNSKDFLNINVLKFFTKKNNIDNIINFEQKEKIFFVENVNLNLQNTNNLNNLIKYKFDNRREIFIEKVNNFLDNKKLDNIIDTLRPETSENNLIYWTLLDLLNDNKNVLEDYEKTTLKNIIFELKFILKSFIYFNFFKNKNEIETNKLNYFLKLFDIDCKFLVFFPLINYFLAKKEKIKYFFNNSFLDSNNIIFKNEKNFLNDVLIKIINVSDYKTINNEYFIPSIGANYFYFFKKKKKFKFPYNEYGSIANSSFLYNNNLELNKKNSFFVNLNNNSFKVKISSKGVDFLNIFSSLSMKDFIPNPKKELILYVDNTFFNKYFLKYGFSNDQTILMKRNSVFFSHDKKSLNNFNEKIKKIYNELYEKNKKKIFSKSWFDDQESKFFEYKNNFFYSFIIAFFTFFVFFIILFFVIILFIFFFLISNDIEKSKNNLFTLKFLGIPKNNILFFYSAFSFIIVFLNLSFSLLVGHLINQFIFNKIIFSFFNYNQYYKFSYKNIIFYLIYMIILFSIFLIFIYYKIHFKNKTFNSFSNNFKKKFINTIKNFHIKSKTLFLKVKKTKFLINFNYSFLLFFFNKLLSISVYIFVSIFLISIILLIPNYFSSYLKNKYNSFNFENVVKFENPKWNNPFSKYLINPYKPTHSNKWKLNYYKNTILSKEENKLKKKYNIKKEYKEKWKFILSNAYYSNMVAHFIKNNLNEWEELFSFDESKNNLKFNFSLKSFSNFFGYINDHKQNLEHNFVFNFLLNSRYFDFFLKKLNALIFKKQICSIINVNVNDKSKKISSVEPKLSEKLDCLNKVFMSKLPFFLQKKLNTYEKVKDFLIGWNNILLDTKNNKEELFTLLTGLIGDNENILKNHDKKEAIKVFGISENSKMFKLSNEKVNKLSYDKNETKSIPVIISKRLKYILEQKLNKKIKPNHELKFYPLSENNKNIVKNKLNLSNKQINKLLFFELKYKNKRITKESWKYSPPENKQLSDKKDLFENVPLNFYKASRKFNEFGFLYFDDSKRPTVILEDVKLKDDPLLKIISNYDKGELITEVVKDIKYQNGRVLKVVDFLENWNYNFILMNWRYANEFVNFPTTSLSNTYANSIKKSKQFNGQDNDIPFWFNAKLTKYKKILELSKYVLIRYNETFNIPLLQNFMNDLKFSTISVENSWFLHKEKYVFKKILLFVNLFIVFFVIIFLCYFVNLIFAILKVSFLLFENTILKLKILGFKNDFFVSLMIKLIIPFIVIGFLLAHLFTFLTSYILNVFFLAKKMHIFIFDYYNYSIIITTFIIVALLSILIFYSFFISIKKINLINYISLKE